MNAPTHIDWHGANQHLLGIEFARLRARLGGTEPEPLDELQIVMPEPPAIEQLVTAFGLSPFERSLLLLAAGVEMDARLHAAAPRLSFGFALGALEGAHWSALSPLAPLRAWRLIEMDGDSVTQARLRIDERVLHYLAGINQLDSRLGALLRHHEAPDLVDPGQRVEAQRLADALAAQQNPLCTVLLSGDDADGQCDVAALAAQARGRLLCVMSQASIPAAPAEQEALALLWQREAVLLPASLLIEAEDASREQAVALSRFVQRLAGTVFIAARESVAVDASLRAQIDKPTGDGQRALWHAALGETEPGVHAAVNAVASQFRLSAAQIARRAEALGDAGHEALAQQLWRDCRDQARPRLDELAQRITPSAGWAELVLPEAQLATLHQLAAQVRQRIRVYADWGFAAQGQRGLGISALFFGESGVGKTLACEVLAKELGLDLYRIDLSAVVSKYIGETEKNLRRVFDAAEDSGAVLLFDEADALFGKRSEVSDARDRYANIEVSYLLQRMEAYRGLAVLTTNQRAALDPAFLRRLRFVLQFPFPDTAQRETIWRRVFPEAMPREALDYAKLARLQMAGGHIRNIALNAAFLAAEADEPVSMAHLARAAHHEAAKNERSLPDVQTRGWA
ncbi:MAG: ATP-binding protein [Rhizobacter sp.]|nr:ATP-binding protein [Rhizobacter sp.]